MRPRLPRTQAEIEDALLALELTERRFDLARKMVLLAISVAFAVVTILCALHGSPWPVPTGTGSLSSITAAVGALGQRRER